MTRWMIDASNVMGSRPDGWWRDRDGATRRLLDELREFADGGQEVTVVLDHGRPEWQGELLAREMLEPTAAVEQLLEGLLRPLFKELCAIVAEILGERADPGLVILCARSIVGQCVFYHHSRPLLRRLSPKEEQGGEQVQRLALLYKALAEML